MAYAKINSVTNANMAKVNNAAKAALGKIGSIDAPSAAAFSTLSTAFDGSNDRITTTEDVTSVDNATASFWFKSSKTSGFQNVFGKSVTDWYIATYNNKMYVKWAGTGSSGITSTGSDVCDGAWHHHVLVFAGGEGVASEIRWYMDGSLEETMGATAGETYTLTSGAVWSIGHYNSTNVFIGNIDEVAVWDGTELDAAAIVVLYNSGAPTDLSSDDGDYDNSSDLTHWWRMGDGDGDGHTGGYYAADSIIDQEGSNNGQMNGMGPEDFEAEVPTA